MSEQRYYPAVARDGRWRCVFCGLFVNQTTGRCARTTWDGEQWEHA